MSRPWGSSTRELSILDWTGRLGWSQHSANGAGGFDHLSSGCPFPVKRTENVHAVLAGLLAGEGPGHKKGRYLRFIYSLKGEVCLMDGACEMVKISTQEPDCLGWNCMVLGII